MDKEDFLASKTKKCIASILDFKETYCDAYLPEDVSRRLRKTILDEVNELSNIASMGFSGQVSLNEDYLEMLTRIHDTVT